MSNRKRTPAQLDAMRAAINDLPVFDRATAPASDYTCSFFLPHNGQDVPVEFATDLARPGHHRMVRCSDGHVTAGIPVRRFRSGSVQARA